MRNILRLALVLALAIPILSYSTFTPGASGDRVRTYTRDIEFDYVTWILDALALKTSQAALSPDRYLTQARQRQTVLEYIQLTRQQAGLVAQVTSIYANPDITDSKQASRELRQRLAGVTARLEEITPLTETILQSQISAVVASLGLTAGGQPVPPIWYHGTPLPLALIISPRKVIHSDADISLKADMNVDQMESLEGQISEDLNVSALVVPIGGVGVYPTMVMRSSDLNWLASTISHEWTHNYLTLHPLGLSYEKSPELRTMNETTANISGNEIGAEVIRRYYPEFAPPPREENPGTTSLANNPVAVVKPRFSFNAQMHAIRVHVDQLLAAGKVTEAEQYMDEGRRIFLDNGYVVRKINQAYFAFYGAYADTPVGAAGEDPVGPAVVSLRQRSSSLLDFLNRISVMTSYEELKKALNQ
ncbi:MAG TPA: hypothetical protein VMT46_02210 [Anaerolineaceae bacterium]|nr:hypothetical protein [Anaerolineaceae bacterium]